MTNTSRTVAGWLNNLVEELESADNPLEYVFFASGNKYYGVVLSALKSAGQALPQGACVSSALEVPCYLRTCLFQYFSNWMSATIQ
jgi:hypothetical protein